MHSRLARPRSAALVVVAMLSATACTYDFGRFRPRDGGANETAVVDDGVRDVPVDVAEDRPSPDVSDTIDASGDTPDVAPPDAVDAMDAAADAMPDVATDAPLDSVSDVGIDAADVVADAVPDVPRDIVDVPPDVPRDVPTCTVILRVNEVQHTGAGSAAGDEWIEIYNAGTCDVNLTGWRLKYSASSCPVASTRWTGVAGDHIAPGTYVLVAGATYSGTALGRLSSGLADTGGGVGLFDPADVRIDSVAYGPGMSGCTNPLAEGAHAANPPMAQSLARMPDGTDTNNNAADFQVRMMPTPGAANR